MGCKFIECERQEIESDPESEGQVMIDLETLGMPIPALAWEKFLSH